MLRGSHVKPVNFYGVKFDWGRSGKSENFSSGEHSTATVKIKFDYFDFSYILANF